MRQKSVLLGSLSAVGCEVLFGLSYVFTKQITNQVGVFELLAWRFLFAFIIMTMLMFIGIIKVNLKNKKIIKLLIISLCCPVLYFIGETLGISLTSSSESGVFLACIPIISLLASTLILHRKPTIWQVVGIIITLIGVLFTVFAVSSGMSFSVLGYVFLILAVISYALYSVFVEKIEGFTETEITYTMIMCGAIIFVSIATMQSFFNDTIIDLVTLPFTNIMFLLTVLYESIGCSVLAFFMSNFAIANIGVNKTSSFIGVSTVVSIISGVIIGESFLITQIIGVIIIIAGVYIANIKTNKDK